MKNKFPWDNFVLVVSHLINDGCPCEVILELRIVLEVAVKEKRICSDKLDLFDEFIKR